MSIVEPCFQQRALTRVEQILIVHPCEVLAKARADMIGLVEEEVQQLQDAIRKLHTHRNALVPFSRLPKELMTHIFGYLMPVALASNQVDRDITTPKRWIAFAQTCSLWRSVAMDSPVLWSNLYLTSEERQSVNLFTNMLARCGPKCTLSIKAYITRPFRYTLYGDDQEEDDPASIFQDALVQLEKALVNPSRLRALDLLAPRAVLTSLVSMIRGSAPELKSLRLAMPRRDLKDANANSAVVVDGLEAPGLRRLDLMGTMKSYTRLAGPNLTHLLLTSLRPKISVIALRNVLRRLPVLTVLHLENAVTTRISQAKAIRVGPGFSRLRVASQITLIEPMETCTELLRKIRLPRGCSIHVTCGTNTTDHSPPSDAADELISLLMAHLQQMRGSGHLRSFDLDSAAKWMSGKDKLHLLCTTVKGHTLSVEITIQKADELRRRINTLVLAALQTFRTRNIRCRCPQSPSDDVWLSLWPLLAELPYPTAPNKKIESFTINAHSRSLDVIVKTWSKSGPTFEISLSGWPQSVSRRSMLSACLYGLQPFRDVKTVTINSTVPVSPALWERTCELFSTAKVLHLYGRSSLRPIKLLGRRNVPSPSLNFPKLESLVLHNTDMGPIRQSTFNELKNMLAIRQSAHALDTLELVNCHSLSVKSESALDELVDTLIITDMVKREDSSHRPYYQKDQEEDWSD